jgi:hypothetical protein
MSILKNKYGFDLGCLEQNILYRAIKNRVRIEGIDETNNNNHYRCNIHHTPSTRKSPLFKKNEEKVIINVDNVPLEFLTHKEYNRGYLHYYTYSNKINGYWIQFYLPVDLVLDGKIFYTTTKIERRKLKINQLKEKFEKRLKKV